MRIAGLVGGIGPESTIDYYRSIVRLYRSRVPDGSYPSVVLNSIDLKAMLDLVAVSDFAALADLLERELQRLVRAGAEFGAIAANTPHVVFDDLERRSPIPLVSIVRVTLEAARARGWKRVGLFGTRFTMEAAFYRVPFQAAGIAVVVPDRAERNLIDEKYFGELVRGVFLPETRQRLVEIAAAMKERDGIEGLILGGTELPLLLKEERSAGLDLLDTTALHVAEIVHRMLA